MNPRKTIYHGGHSEHGEKTRVRVDMAGHPTEDVQERIGSSDFAVPAVFAVVD